MNLSHQGPKAVLLGLAILVGSTTLYAEEELRTWKDATGKFEVEAKLVKHADGKVQLLKKDGLVITVPESALSEADQKYLKSLAEKNPFFSGTPLEVAGGGKSAGPPTTDLATPSGKVKVLPTSNRPIFLNSDEPLPAIDPDPTPKLPEFQPYVRTLEKLDAYARCSKPIQVDPKGPTLAVSTHRVGNAVDNTTFGRLYLTRKDDNSAQLVLDIKTTILLFDHHIESGRSLAALGVNSPSERGGDLVLLDHLATGNPEAVARWHLPSWDSPGFKPKIEFARLLDANRAIVQVNDKVYLWDVAKGKQQLQIDGLQAGAKLDLSGTGKYLALPTGGGCRIVDLVKGELLGMAPFTTSLAPEVRFSPNGERLAMVGGNQFVVWDLTKANVASQATVGVSCGAFYGWIGDKYLLTQLSGLIDPDLGLTLWSYGLPTGGLNLTMPGGVATVDTIGAATVICLPVPHEPVKGMAERLSGSDSDLMAVYPGTKVTLNIEAPDSVNTTKVRANLKAAAERAGWKVVDNAPIEVVATIVREKKRNISFRYIGRSMRTPAETVSIRPYRSGLEIRKGNQAIWSRVSMLRVPTLIRLKKGESLKAAVKRFEEADTGYFEFLQLPPKILRPEVGKNVGRSTVRNGRWQDSFPSQRR